MGNRQSFSQSTSRPDMSGPSSFGSQQSTRPNPVGAPASGGGMFSRPGLGGMLGGLLVGGLLGSMFFGGGHGYGGPGLFDLLLVGGGLFLLFRFLRSRRPAPAAGPNAARTYEAEPLRPAMTPAREAAANGWANLGGTSPASGAAGGWSNLDTSGAPSGPQAPEGFDADDFLSGAKTLFARLQRSWSVRDLGDIAAFSTPVFMEDVRKQAAADPNPTPTDVLLVDAKLLEVRKQGNTTIASAYFDTLLREDPKAERSEQVREVWHFVRRDDVPGDTWRLDAIQQLDG